MACGADGEGTLCRLVRELMETKAALESPDCPTSKPSNQCATQRRGMTW